MKRIVLVCAAALLCPRPASAQEDRLGRRLDPSTAAAVLALVDSARVLSLPTEPLVQKAMEGASKGASPEAIVTAVRDFVRDLSAARDVLGDDVAADPLQLGAAALKGGATREELGRLRVHRGKVGFQGALAGVVYLLSRGVSAGASIGIVSSMLDAGLGQVEFASLQHLVEQDVRGGLPSADAAVVRAQALIRHGPHLRPGGGPGR